MTRMARRLLLPLLLGVLTVQAGEQDAQEKQRQLQELRNRILRVQNDLAEDLGKRDAVNRELRSAEEELGVAANRLRDINIRIDARQERLDELEAEQRARQAALAAERSSLAAQIRAAYIAGREEKMKLLLNQQDPAQFGRVLVYYDYLNRERTERIDRVNAQLQRLADLEIEINTELETLEAARAERKDILAQLETTRDQRAQALAALEVAIRDRHSELQKLERDEKALADLVQSLLDVFADIPAQFDKQIEFGSLRGKLPWPSGGKVVANYGESRADGRMRWNGLMIAAAPGTPVRAISYGRVAYADWLPHYGLLLIIEHGDEFLSLYGHNQTLYKEVGDWVEAGEIIAAMGDSGGQQRAALYFEIRKGKNVQDPRRWLAKGP